MYRQIKKKETYGRNTPKAIIICLYHSHGRGHIIIKCDSYNGEIEIIIILCFRTEN